MNMKWIGFAVMGIVSLTLSSCSMMLPDRSFIEQMERQSDPFFAPGKDFPIVGGDDGETRLSPEELNARIPASRRSSRLSRESVSIREELAEKEANLEEEELGLYLKNKKYLETDSDKLYYLSLSPDEQISYIRTKKDDIKEELELRSNMLAKRSIHSNEIFLGMGKSDVVTAWGKPGRVEIAGNPGNQNERWTFFEDGSVKQVYFEGGTVQGWALDL